MKTKGVPAAISGPGRAGAAPEFSRPVRSWDYVDVVGLRAAVAGIATGTMEAWIHPLKILKDLHLQFTVSGRSTNAEALARRVVSRPGSVSIVYACEDFRVRQTFAVPVDRPGILMRLKIDAYSPVEIKVHFKSDLQLMWPATVGGSYTRWTPDFPGFLIAVGLGLGEGRFAGMIASPDAELVSCEYTTNYAASEENVFSLGTVKGAAVKYVAVTGTLTTPAELAGSYRAIIADPERLFSETERFYQNYLDRTVSVRLPDPQLQQAYDWSRLNVMNTLVDSPYAGIGLMAGFGLSHGASRPGYGWFFGRDTCWSTFALTAVGDFESAREAIRMVGKYQRDDGKIPHEVSQTVGLVRWFEDFHYAFTAADATPLFVIAMRDYVESSGDVGFLKESWGRLQKAMSFLRSTYDDLGLAKNLDVGTGWVEGGPLMPVLYEFYQAGVGLEAVRSFAKLSQWMGEEDESKRCEQEFALKLPLLHKVFWLPEEKSYAFGVAPDGKPVKHASGTAAVPMWFGLLDCEPARRMIQLLADEPLASDWGMRVTSSRRPENDPNAAQSGSVWPLFTGWASVAEYRYHQPLAGFAGLKTNALLTLDGGGNTAEVLSGAIYAPLSSNPAHQTWSSAMIVAPLLRGLLGLEVDAVERNIRLAPHLPAGWTSFDLTNVPLPGGSADFHFLRDARHFSLNIENRCGEPFRLVFSPAYAPCAEIESADFNGAEVSWENEDNGSDFHPAFSLSVPSGENILKASHRHLFGFSVPLTAPEYGEESSNLKIISEEWSEKGAKAHVIVSGRPGKRYRIDLCGGENLAAIEGAELNPERSVLHVLIPAGDSQDYRTLSIELTMKPKDGDDNRAH